MKSGTSNMLGPPLVISDGLALAEVYPTFGAAIGRFDLLQGSRHLAIFQTEADPERGAAPLIGSKILLPFSNRISGGGFWHQGRFHALEPNVPGSPYPIHGNASQEKWTVAAAGPLAVTMQLASSGPGPFRYDARLVYRLESGALRMSLTVRNTADISLPFGMGFHPWFVRTPQTRLMLRAKGYWTEDRDHLPDVFVLAGNEVGIDFSAGSSLPGRVNNAFTGWDGVARIDWPDRGVSVRLTATPPLTTAIVYSASSGCNFFCVEPVSHSVDAHNRSEPETASPQILAPGEELSASALVEPSHAGAF